MRPRTPRICSVTRHLIAHQNSSSHVLCRVRRDCPAQQRAISSVATLLQHRHLRGSQPGGFLPYDEAHAAQEERRSELLRWKALKDTDRGTRGNPRPMVISFESEPTFTLGRRQDDLTDEQAGHLTTELRIRFNRREGLVQDSLRPVVRRTQRGGLTTYHGPGQLVLWPVLDMHSPLYPQFSVSSYAHCLEATTQRFLAKFYDLETVTSGENPGVWIADAQGRPARKIAALGVHHRRHVTGLGTAINVDVPTEGAVEGNTNPWSRFEPCGLSAEGVTSIEREIRGKRGHSHTVWDLEQLAEAWGALFEEALTDARKR